MILRPVSPASPIGPPVTNRPVGLTWMIGSVSRSSRGIVGRTTASVMSSRRRSTSTSGSCWAETTTVRTATGVPLRYSTVIWVLPSGRRYGSCPDLRDAASCRAIRCASAIGSGMSSGVSRQANPNIIPWSPAPSSLRRRAVANLEGRVDALGDVRRLALDRHQRAAGLVVEPVVGARVADVAHGVADDRLEVDVGVGRDLAEHEDEPRRRRRLAGDAGVRVVAQDRVQDGVRDLVAHLVRVAFGDRLGREQVVVGVDDAHAAPRCRARRVKRRRG